MWEWSFEVGGYKMDIKYERFFIFCYIWGRIGYVEKDCSEVEEEDEGEMFYNFGDWLKVSFFKKFGRLSAEEVWIEKEKLYRRKNLI